MTLAEIYDEYVVGSEGFVVAVDIHCGYNISKREIRRIANRAPTPEQFQTIWENETDWADEHNGQ